MAWLPTKPTITVRDVVDRIELVARASQSSDNCKHSKSNECQKPVSDNVLTIVLAVVIPVVVILSVLGWFLYRNYRKDKKEAMEHDPDFDENGEATALPDFPQANMYHMEDPFHNRNSLRYPQAPMHPGLNKSTTSLSGTTQGDPYLDNFVLPYHSQVGSKVSLDDYAKQFASNPGYSQHTPSASFSKTRHSSMSNFPTPGVQHSQISPQKSTTLRQTYTGNNEKNSENPRSPTKKVGDREYTNIPNDSTASFGRPTVPNVKESHSDLEMDSNSDMEEKDHSNSHSSEGYGHTNEKFGVNYENESNVDTSRSRTSTTSYDSVPDRVGAERGIQHVNDNAKRNGVEDKPASTFDNRTEATGHVPERSSKRDYVSQHALGNEVQNNDADEEPEDDDDDAVDGDFNFSSSNDNTRLEDDDENADAGNSLSLPRPNPGRSKSPRISAFNLLKNDSDDENDDLTPEQKEEIQRMKSVYKVYFDKDQEKNGNQPFVADASQLVPPIPVASSRINKDLRMDTNYEKRLTTASSIYNENIVYPHEEQYYYQPNYQGEQYPPQEQYYYEDPAQDYSNHPQARPELPPLQKLRNASDIRHSTLQTYTDFQPRSKNAVVISPNSKVPINPIDDGVWQPVMSSPTLAQSQSSYSVNQQVSHSPQQMYSPTMSNGTAPPPNAVPSATQLSRSSVVMLNPVTEITSRRMFKPAGSLQQNGMGHSQSNTSLNYIDPGTSFNGPENDLIPGNRKSDVRRMMNTNF
ncbi:uncharacterized protein RJT20DRAFT_136197 [Scheffersomyces xylosifermentans]|uniref:uncharacterized protein n=1 Tax=Scheffersomyces xylosifermentans TaxID=1304137 RepID=UPI00315D377F